MCSSRRPVPVRSALLGSIQGLLSAGKAVTYAAGRPSAGAPLVGEHAYTVDAVVSDASGQAVGLRLRNPWGVDNYTSTDDANDGYVTLSAAEAFSALPFVMSAAC